jgi:hypothetical protein
MFVPKSHYLRLSADWQACVATGPVTTTPLAYAPVVTLVASPIAPEAPAIASPSWALAPGRLAPAHAGWTQPDVLSSATIGGAVLFVLLLGAAATSFAPRPIPPHIRRAGECFATAFARPLVDPSSNAPPIQTRLRFVRRTQQLEISIAPGPGRRYPNLADHKRNVEYDVSRILRVLGNHYVLTNRPRAAGKWVVVTIRPADSKQTGAT